MDVRPGDRLSEVPHQDSYRYIVGHVYLGGDSHEDIGRRHAEVARMLPFDIEPVEEDAA